MGASSQPLQGEPAVGYPAAHSSQPLQGDALGQPVWAPRHGSAVDQATYFPAEETEPRFVGARTGHGSMLMHCGACEYIGRSRVRPANGAVAWLVGAMTLGLTLLTPLFKDTAHDCPRCGRQVAVAKIM